MQLSQEVKDLLLRLNETPENFTGRINDISCGSKDNEKECESNVKRTHPRVHCPEVGFKSKGSGRLSIHCAADLETIETIFRTFTYVNQLSLYGAVAEMCEDYETFHDETVKPVVGGQSSSSFVPSVIKTDESGHQNPNQIHRHQKPTRRHLNQREFHT